MRHESELNPESCRRLTSRMRKGDEAAWREFHRCYLEFLLAYAGSRGVVGPDAYDLVQATYLRVLRHVKEFPDEGALKGWLRCLLRCELIDQARKGTRRLALLEKYAHWQDGRTSPATMDHVRVEEILMDLPEVEQKLMMRSCVEGWTHQELALEARTTPKAIESKLARIRRRLREGWTENQ